MKNKKGFTLIELLAVIVVLAIIALIATPIVMNTIKNAKKGAAERGADNYIKQVETAIATSKLDGNDVLDGTYTIDENGNLTGNGLTEPITIEMNGEKPKSGSIVIKNGQVTTDSSMTIGEYTVSYNPTNEKYEATEKNNTLVCDLQEGTSQTVGAKYTCHLDSDRTFYVLETSGDNVNLIMDRNFTDETVPKELTWCIDNGRDNTTCKNINSKEEGTPLKHIQDTFGSKVKVSFPTKEQIATVSGITLNSDTYSISGVSEWLTGNYWVASPFVNVADSAWIVTTGNYLTGTYVYDSEGLRPVITIQKTQLS